MRRAVRLFVLGLALVPPAAATAAERGPLVAATEQVSVAPGSTAKATFVVGAGPKVVSFWTDPEHAVIVGCPGHAPATRVRLGTPRPQTVAVCLKGGTAGATRLLAVTDNGHSVAVPVAVEAPPTKPDGASRPSAPGTLSYVSDDAHLHAQVGDFAVPGAPSVLAAGPNDVATVTLSTADVDCAATPPTAAPTATAAPTPAPTGPVRLTACGLDEIGKYTAAFDLNGAAEGGALTITLVRRRTALLALVAVLGGIAVAVAVSALLAYRKRRGDEEKRAATVAGLAALHEEVVDRLALVDLGGDTAPLAQNWLPGRWPGLTRDAAKLTETAALYRRATACVPRLLGAYRHFKGETGEPPLLARDARSDLAFGIAPQGERDTPEKIVSFLERHAAAATVALAEHHRLGYALTKAPADQRDALQAARDRLAHTSLDGIEALLDAPDPVVVEAFDEVPRVTVLAAERALTGLTGGGRIVGRLRGAAPPPAGGTPPAAGTTVHVTPAARRLSRGLDTRTAAVLASVLGLLAAIPVGMSDALDPNAAWGTWADLVKMFGAALVLPALLNETRKALIDTDT
jgi:hypothetical protein